jgi:hypothetical protein
MHARGALPLHMRESTSIQAAPQCGERSVGVHSLVVDSLVVSSESAVLSRPDQLAVRIDDGELPSNLTMTAIGWVISQCLLPYRATRPLPHTLLLLPRLLPPVIGLRLSCSSSRPPSMLLHQPPLSDRQTPVAPPSPHCPPSVQPLPPTNFYVCLTVPSLPYSTPTHTLTTSKPYCQPVAKWQALLLPHCTTCPFPTLFHQVNPQSKVSTSHASLICLFIFMPNLPQPNFKYDVFY